MCVHIKTILLLLVIVLAIVNMPVLANELDPEDQDSIPMIEIPMAVDLPTVARVSKQKKLPIILLFSAEDCEFCERLEAEVIRPMLISGEMETKAIVRKVMIDSYEQIKDFHGADVGAEEFADRRGIEVTPTLQFVDAEGRELAEKMIGFQGSEMFVAYLDNALSSARQKLVKKLPRYLQNL